MSIGRFSLMITVLLTQLIISATASELGPQGVSPGTPDRVARIDSACPTFIWEATPGARRYEVVVYRFDNKAPATTSFELSPDNEVLFTMVSGRATGWTPESGDCFSPGETYAWFVRAVMDADTGEGSEWSEPRFFEVAAAPSANELERAIEVLRRWEAATGGLSPTLSSAAAPVAAPDTASAPVPDSGSGSGSSHPKSVTTGTAAIRGEQPDLSGETYGVVGTSASPDGAGIGAANTGGGPDLVLDGAVPAEISEAGVDRPSGSPQTFSFANTGGGGMMLDIEGIPVVTTATDQDTVGALSCDPGELPKWNGAAWVCAPDLDTDTDTLAALAPCGAGEVAKWTGSFWDCAPDADTLDALNCGRNEIAKWNDTGSVWECAADNNTTYSFGPGLILDGGQVRLDPGLFSSRVSVVDSDGWVGYHNAVAIGADGLGLISYYEETFGAFQNLKVAHCNNNDCTSATISLLDDNLSGDSTSIGIADNGLGLISYFDGSNGHLKAAQCNNILCTTAILSTVDSASNVGRSASIVIGDDGLGMISYYDQTNGNLKVAHCIDSPCTHAVINTVDWASGVGEHTAITIGPDGRGLISFSHNTGTAYHLIVAHLPYGY